MSFKDSWRPRIDGIDIADSSAVNEIAEEVIKQEKSIDFLRRGYDYHKTISEVNKTGYIAFDLRGGDSVEIKCSYFRYAETNSATLFQIFCDETSVPSHKLVVNVGDSIPTHYRGEIITPENAKETWFIPFTFEQGISEHFEIFVKGVILPIDYDLNARFVEALPNGVEPIYPTIYATRKDIGNIDTALDNIIAIQEALIGGDA